ncbi:hypothetical protein [Acetobacter sp. UBA5411]|uniref:hypothetical protein n=1 Tax=Acetobacter sp. UBA5411 TaxID=1945905 RepID=UPI0025BA6308|nr:hypothetical protein [Acetobacter sp. UBA5411]
MTSNNSNKSPLIVGAKVRVKHDNAMFNSGFEGKVGEVTGFRGGYVHVRFENGGTDFGFRNDVEVIGLPKGTRVRLKVAGGVWVPRLEGMAGAVSSSCGDDVYVRFDNGNTDYGEARYLEVLPEAQKPAFERLSVGDRIRVISTQFRFMGRQMGKTGIVEIIRGREGSRGRIVDVCFDDGSTDEGREAECEKLAPITVSSDTAKAAESPVKVSRITAGCVTLEKSTGGSDFVLDAGMGSVGIRPECIADVISVLQAREQLAA